MLPKIRNRMRLLVCALLFVGMTCAVMCSALLTGSFRRVISKRPSSMRVFGSEKELWIFLQLDERVRSPGLLATPPITASCEQYVIWNDGERWQDPVRAEAAEGLTFNTNLSQILRSGDSFYLLSGGTPDTGALVYQWDGRRFAPLDPAASARIKRSIGINDTISVFGNRKKIDQETLQSGFKVLYETNHAFTYWEGEGYENPEGTPIKFQWRGREHAVIRTLGDISTIEIVMVDGQDMKSYELVRFDSREHYLSREDRKRLSKNLR